jgi:hypothetical protein
MHLRTNPLILNANLSQVHFSNDSFITDLGMLPIDYYLKCCIEGRD